jgi:hypothetical protein
VKSPEDQALEDAAKRIRDEMNMHAVAGAYGFAVFALADGSPMDHTPYPTWQAAVKAAKHDRDNYMFLEIKPDGMGSLREAAAPLQYARVLHSQGYRVPSPGWEAGPLASSMPHQPWDRARMAVQLGSGKPLDTRGFTNLPSERRMKHG